MEEFFGVHGDHVVALGDSEPTIIESHTPPKIIHNSWKVIGRAIAIFVLLWME